MTVVLWGRADEAVVAAVAAALSARHARFLAIDSSDIASLDRNRGRLSTSAGHELDLATVSGVLVRPEGLNPDPDVYAAIAAWTEHTDVAVLNRLSAGASNLSKPYQLRLLADAGFDVPDTLVTTDPDDVRAFRAEHDQVIYKSTSGVRSIAGLLAADHDARLSDVANCPTQFQQYVAGTDHRVHVVGDNLFACRIESAATDYRYAAPSGHSVAMHPVELPEDIAARCVRVTKDLGLRLAGVDLRLDADGRWWCFEVNTAPGFVWFEAQTGQPIARAVAALLSEGADRRQR